ncbi:MAG TPA: hypothetical protein VEQ17_02770 [Steroidobacteraceae bacterium]|nr:hypothetical protein [Steroidobacteraceae bacterium]
MNRSFTCRIIPQSWALPLVVSICVIPPMGALNVTVGFLCIHAELRLWSATPWKTNWRGKPHAGTARP